MGRPSETGELESNINVYGTETNADKRRTQEAQLLGSQTIPDSTEGSLLYVLRRGTT